MVLLRLCPNNDLRLKEEKDPILLLLLTEPLSLLLSWLLRVRRLSLERWIRRLIEETIPEMADDMKKERIVRNQSYILRVV